MSGRKSFNVRFQTPEQRIQTYRRAQAISVGNEYSRRNAQKMVESGYTSHGIQRLATRRAPSRTVLVEANQARFSQQMVTANFTATANGTTDSITSMSDSMRLHGFDRSKAPMTGSLVKGQLISHDNRRLVAAKTANIWVPMKLEAPFMQNIDMSSQERAISSTARQNNTVNDFLIHRTSPSKKAEPDIETVRRGYSEGFTSVKFKTAMKYEGIDPDRRIRKQIVEQAERTLIDTHPSIAGSDN